MSVALRTALIWHDEVMNDLVLEKPGKITLGATGSATFVVPDIGLPANFTIVQPGNRGYLLTLGQHMKGTICIDGVEKSVEEFVQRGGEGGEVVREEHRPQDTHQRDARTSFIVAGVAMVPVSMKLGPLSP